MNNPPRVTVTQTTPAGERIVIALGGEIDHSTAHGMHDDVLAMTDGGALHLVLDFSAVGFCDSSGLSALLGIWRRLNANGGTLTITAAPPTVTKAMRIGGMDRLITIRPRPTGTTTNPTP